MKMLMRGAAFFATTGALLALAASGACGKSSSGGGGNPTPVAVPNDLNFEIQSATVPATGNPSVTFRVTDASGQPIDLIKEIKNGAPPTTTPPTPPTRPSTSAPRFTLSQLKDDGTYVDYYQNTATGKPYVTDTGTVNPALPTATQAAAAAVPTTDPTLSQRLVSAGNGVYTFDLGPPVVTGLDPTKTHTVGMWATRTLAAAGDPGHPAHATFNFVPAGGAATKREVVSDQACNTCHTVLEAHDRRTGTQLCITCHSPQTTDPETGNTVDFRVMIHKIHRGETLPSVKSGTPYRIVGFAAGNPTPLPASAVQDFSDVAFPRPVTDCTVCHQGAQGDNWKNAPSATACLACHDNVKFDGSAGATVCAPGVTGPCNHKGGQIHPSTACSACHTATEIQTVHVDAATAASKSFKYEIMGVTLGGDRKPVVQLRVTDPASGTPYVLNASGGTPSAPFSFTANGASRLFVDIGWPSEDYANAGGSATAPGQPVQINVLGTATPVAGQAGVYQVTSPTAVPADTSFTVALEGHPAITSGATQIRVPVPNDVKYFSAAGAPNGPARRVVVSVDKCNACHGLLSLHGNNRTGTTQVCVVCHNPDATDKGQRVAASPPITDPETPIDLKWMIHAIHAPEDQKLPFTIIGFGGSHNQFPAGFPGRSDNCNNCHVNDSWKLPITDAAHDTTYDTGASISDPSDNLRWNKTKAVCSACHDTPSQGFDPIGHMDTMVAANRACSECHGDGGSMDISKVHRIVPEGQLAQ